MAFPKKGLRKITVNKIKYVYNITGNDDWISFSIGQEGINGEIVTGGFSYVQNLVTNFDKNGKIISWSPYQRIQITPNTIRQVIEYALMNGWNPIKNKGQLRLGNMDDKIDLNLKESTIFPELDKNQVVIKLTEIHTGRILQLNKLPFDGEGKIYKVCNSINEAKGLITKIVQEDAEIECWIMTNRENVVFRANQNEAVEFKQLKNIG